MSELVKLNVGSIDEMGKRFVDAWHKLERGEEIQENKLTFFDPGTMVSTLSPKQLELLRHVHGHPVRSVAELAKALARDCKRVHADLAALEHAGLLVRDEGLIKAPYDRVQANVSLLS